MTARERSYIIQQYLLYQVMRAELYAKWKKGSTDTEEYAQLCRVHGRLAMLEEIAQKSNIML